MVTVLRLIAAVVAGMVTALILVGVELVSAIVYPTPTDFGGTAEEMREYVADSPLLAVATVAWGIAAFLGTWVANRIGGRRAAIVVGLLLLGGLVFNISSLPYTLWFKVVIVPVIVAAIALAIRRPEGSCKPSKDPDD